MAFRTLKTAAILLGMIAYPRSPGRSLNNRRRDFGGRCGPPRSQCGQFRGPAMRLLHRQQWNQVPRHAGKSKADAARPQGQPQYAETAHL